MRRKAYGHGAEILIWLAAGLSHIALAQSPALGQGPQQSSTVVVAAPRPVKQPMVDTEARIRKIVSGQATAFEGLLRWCLKGPITNLDFKIMCGRSHIQAKDKSLGEGLEAFEKHDYAIALQRFEAAHEKVGYPDAALMLAHMHRQGLGTPKDAVQGIRWLRAVAEDRFNPHRDRMRFNPRKPETTNARIEAAMALARIYQLGDEAERDWAEAERWYVRAAEFGFVPAWNTLGEYYLGRDGVVRDLDRAYRYFSMAAEEGHSGPQLAIGRMSALGEHAQAAPELAKPAGHGLPGPVASAAADEMVLPAESHGQAGEGLAMVRVTGLRAVPWKSYGAMRAAVSAYEKHQSLAPDAVFSFALMPPAGMQLPPNFALRVRTETGQEFPIPLEHGELFTLPLLPDLEAEADLVSNFKGGTLRIGLLVHTPTVSPEKLRLGDLRLRYEINAAIAMFDDPQEYDAQCKGTGRWSRCKRPSKAIWHQPWAATSGAWIIEGSRRTPLQANDDPKNPMYRMPIASGQWSNDAIIEFDYKVPLLRPRKLFEVAIYNAND